MHLLRLIFVAFVIALAFVSCQDCSLKERKKMAKRACGYRRRRAVSTQEEYPVKYNHAKLNGVGDDGSEKSDPTPHMVVSMRHGGEVEIHLVDKDHSGGRIFLAREKRGNRDFYMYCCPHNPAQNCTFIC